jgi:hypothetical protein
VSREWRIAVELLPDATDDEADLVLLALEMASVDVEREGDDLVVFVDAPHSVKRAKQRILHALADSGVAEVVRTPLPAFRWDPKSNVYVDPDAPEPIEDLRTDTITWKVRVRPRDVWVEHALREEIERRGRPVIGKKGRWIEIGAADEADASSLVAGLSELPETGEATAERLGRFARWRVREHLLGGYADVQVGPYDLGDVGAEAETRRLERAKKDVGAGVSVPPTSWCSRPYAPGAFRADSAVPLPAAKSANSTKPCSPSRARSTSGGT